ncbi:hypothetical protein [Bryobacter aggregatus]|uniref:hypothetical protein n=1 Tax=Bryobacter aggregatus TaxID=360054 RepID=UPI0004E0B697|nr:hypothetical protein [Bryobacter aggregatus]
MFWPVLALAQSAGQLIFPDETDPPVLQWADVAVQEFLAIHQMPSARLPSSIFTPGGPIRLAALTAIVTFCATV